MERVFPAQIQQLAVILSWIRNQWETAGLSKAVSRKMELACEEAIVNIIHHAYKANEGTISVCVRPEKDRVKTIIQDRGPFFNPLLENAIVDVSLDLDQRIEGGLGLYFIRQLMDEVHYERRDGLNILTLVKKT